MAKKTIILGCRFGKNLVGDKVEVNEKMATILISKGGKEFTEEKAK